MILIYAYVEDKHNFLPAYLELALNTYEFYLKKELILESSYTSAYSHRLFSMQGGFTISVICYSFQILIPIKI